MSDTAIKDTWLGGYSYTCTNGCDHETTAHISMPVSEAYVASLTAQNEASAELVNARAHSEYLWGFWPFAVSLSLLLGVIIVCITHAVSHWMEVRGWPCGSPCCRDASEQVQS